MAYKMKGFKAHDMYDKENSPYKKKPYDKEKKLSKYRNQYIEKHKDTDKRSDDEKNKSADFYAKEKHRKKRRRRNIETYIPIPNKWIIALDKRRKAKGKI